MFIHFLPDEIGRRWLCYINPFSRLQNYGIGVLLALYWTDIEQVFKKIIGKSIISYTLCELFAISLLFISFLHLPESNINNVLGVGSVLLELLLCIFITIFSIGQGSISRVLSMPFWGKLGQVSIVIFMSHSFVLHYAEPLFEISSVLYLIVVYFITIIISIIIDRCFYRYMKHWLLCVCSKKQ